MSSGSRAPWAASTPEAETSLVRMRFVGTNPHAGVRAEDEQITRTNYFLGNDPGKWRTDIPNYGRVRYAGIYPGIDLVYYGNQHQLEHDFVVEAGADPYKIALSLEGEKDLRIDAATGDLVLGTEGGSLRLLKPVAYQEVNGSRVEVSSSYRLLTGNLVGFKVGSYNHARPLLIDPILVYSTYLGGSGNSNDEGDQGNGIAVDSNGDAYIVGTTFSTNFPVTAGVFQTQSYATNNSSTVFITELNPTGTALVYSTYLVQ